ncbi:methylmalonate-semialdehyde dehydrogenase (acylating) (plasmid) [Rubrobacter radiotolerans]|uniref:methylmalonate-semialdehyde dehydrogenase (CoA acylating) n=1 Tax=Rubrobacter radiotolerans TaxID=42256 RepID=A0A023X7Y1_RUBRA|nr:CoA-acylating methylmalonate-semialdehyde dehydrogenase [Rubrobacter radiotolerans]AHY48326.1 methylmalonate-semialdehyde dehydrogenase (acylating) [Rubrobacter radiotolerans]MDX5895462.1 CoA-acylating methylmalonate-semialdehyde dehydrogenase [Rubrobacter radiotolerans]SMC01523.1 methylmalonate-semialdehyde dehydrogenase [acylating] [Rubrobacter radiotolerans DSM 5868]
MHKTKREVRNFVGGEWVEANGRKTEAVYNPATGEVIAKTPLSTKEDVERAVGAAEAAFSGWSATPVTQRARVLFRFKMLLEEHFEELRDLVTLENGKDAKDAAGEVRRGIEVVEFACGMPSLMMGETVRDVASGIDNVSWRYPLGVVAAIVPFNFPCMIPLWTMPVAVGAGNTYLLKPSERTPLCSKRLVELFVEAGVPEGVVNLVNGAHETVNAILEHPRVKAVSFVGSQPVAEHVYKTGTASGKRVQALAGAKNSMIVLPDAVLEKAVPNIVSSAYGNAGERCLAGSVLVAVGEKEAQDRVVEKVREAASSMKVGAGYEEGSELTPLIRDSHRQKVRSYVDLGEKEGAEVVLDGREVRREEGFFFGPTILDGVTGEMRVAREEIFGPVLSVVRVDTLEEAVAFTNGSPFGNACSIYTENGAAVRYWREHVEAGMLGVNIGVAAPMAFFPFNGVKNSFYGDLHATGKDGVRFFTENKVEVVRYLSEPASGEAVRLPQEAGA